MGGALVTTNPPQKKFIKEDKVVRILKRKPLAIQPVLHKLDAHAKRHRAVKKATPCASHGSRANQKAMRAHFRALRQAAT